MSGMGAEAGFSHHMNGGSRKYQCKMCPQVRTFSSLTLLFALSCTLHEINKLELQKVGRESFDEYKSGF